MPLAMPLVMVSPSSARSLLSRSATARPYWVSGRLVPTMPILRAPQQVAIAHCIQQYRRVGNFREHGGIGFVPVENQPGARGLDLAQLVRRGVEGNAGMYGFGNRGADTGGTKL